MELAEYTGEAADAASTVILRDIRSELRQYHPGDLPRKVAVGFSVATALGEQTELGVLEYEQDWYTTNSYELYRNCIDRLPRGNQE